MLESDGIGVTSLPNRINFAFGFRRSGLGLGNTDFPPVLTVCHNLFIKKRPAAMWDCETTANTDLHIIYLLKSMCTHFLFRVLLVPLNSYIHFTIRRYRIPSRNQINGGAVVRFHLILGYQ